MEVEGKQELFLFRKRATVARAVYNLCKSPYQDCYASKVFRYLPNADSMHTVLDAIQLFEECGWIERREREGRTRLIELTDDGDRVFSELERFLEVLGW